MKRVRQYIGILAAAAAYYSVHEGAHLLCPEWIARSIFAGLLIVNGWIFWKRIFPVYKESFSNEEPS